MGMSGQLDKGQQIDGGTDNTPIGNDGDKLRVASTVSPVPLVNVIYAHARLRDTGGTGTADMNVDGSGTPVHYDYVPATGEVWYLESLSLLIVDPGVASYDNFGSLSQLSNGLQLRVKSGGVEYTITNLQNNAEISLLFSENSFTTASSSGWMDDLDVYQGTRIWKVPMRLDGDQGDFVRLRVRDNLTGLEALRASVNVWRTI